jgi:hypothetical protein
VKHISGNNKLNQIGYCEIPIDLRADSNSYLSTELRGEVFSDEKIFQRYSCGLELGWLKVPKITYH